MVLRSGFEYGQICILILILNKSAFILLNNILFSLDMTVTKTFSIQLVKFFKNIFVQLETFCVECNVT